MFYVDDQKCLRVDPDLYEQAVTVRTGEEYNYFVMDSFDSFKPQVARSSACLIPVLSHHLHTTSQLIQEEFPSGAAKWNFSQSRAALDILYSMLGRYFWQTYLPIDADLPGVQDHSGISSSMRYVAAEVSRRSTTRRARVSAGSGIAVFFVITPERGILRYLSRLARKAQILSPSGVVNLALHSQETPAALSVARSLSEKQLTFSKSCVVLEVSIEISEDYFSFSTLDPTRRVIHLLNNLADVQVLNRALPSSRKVLDTLFRKTLTSQGTPWEEGAFPWPQLPSILEEHGWVDLLSPIIQDHLVGTDPYIQSGREVRAISEPTGIFSTPETRPSSRSSSKWKNI